MTFALFFLLTQSEIVELDKKNFDTVIKGEQPVLVKFTSPNCGHCRRMAPDFEEASEMFKDVVFANTNCVEHRDLCEKFKVDGYPTVKIFVPGKDEPVDYEGDRSPDSFADFVEKHTTAKAKRPPKVVRELNSVNYNESIEKFQCNFVTFYSPYCGHCKRFLPTVKLIAEAFVPDTNVSIARLDCVSYKEFCQENGITGFPTIKLIKGEETIEYEGDRSPDDVAEFINSHCGTERAPNGLLNDAAGLINETEGIIAEFLTGNKDAAMEKMKAIEGATFYVKVMERIKAKGVEVVQSDIATIGKILGERKGSAASLDSLKKRYNVFSKFESIIHPPTPAPTPVPEADAAQEGDVLPPPKEL